ncbi:hypothetical protein [Bradyrhizobium roseum]|uniref:hypothetical protein n=1 Tax=Bradyrhizobium roseum TaxID=3056648 RepID=UPI00262CCC32|nr:hypothetical protein [Bradyrhizobium roseus]WKA30037.1 hypothetical protein QUH67_07655 [Bradyrhizobium roseus]
MAAEDPDYAIWLPVIGKSLAYLCLSHAVKEHPVKLKEVLPKVEFLEALGVPTRDAAHAAGSSVASVAELRRLAKRRKANGKKGSKKSARPDRR